MGFRQCEVIVPRLESWVISSNLYWKKKKCWSQSTGCHISSTLDELWAFNQSSGDSRASSPFNYISCSRYETKAEGGKKGRNRLFHTPMSLPSCPTPWKQPRRLIKNVFVLLSPPHLPLTHFPPWPHTKEAETLWANDSKKILGGLNVFIQAVTSLRLAVLLSSGRATARHCGRGKSSATQRQKQEGIKFKVGNFRETCLV